MPTTLIERLLQYEADTIEELMSYHFSTDEIALWPFIRYKLFAMTNNAVTGMRSIEAATDKTAITKLRFYFVSLYKSFLKVRHHYPVVIYSHDAGTAEKRNGKWFNRISDYFSDVYSDTLMLYNIQGTSVKTPKYSRHFGIFNSMGIKVYFKKKLSRCSLSTQDGETIDALLQFLGTSYPFALEEVGLPQLRARLAELAVTLPMYRTYFDSFLSRVKPSIILWEDASYMTYGFLTKWCKDAGAAVGELQHGYVGFAHHAYNYHPATCAHEEMRRYMPDYFLTYGDFWNTTIRIPGKSVTIGNPHFAEKVKHLTIQEEIGSPTTMLYISDGMTVDATKAFLLASAASLRDKRVRILFRPHPLEKTYVAERYPEFMAHDVITVCAEGDIYPLLARSTWVCGTFSTVVFEAAALGKRVFIVDTPGARMYISREFGTWIFSPEELVQQLRDTLIAPRMQSPEYYFATDWKERYRTFLQSVGVHEHENGR